MVSLRNATSADEQLFVDTLEAAFADDPVHLYLARPGPKRGPGLRAFCRVLFRLYARQNLETVWIADEGAGVIVWLPPGGWNVSWWQEAPALPDYIRFLGWSGVMRGLRFGGAIDGAHPAEPHWYLQIVGVRPDQQGHGVGRALIQPMLDRFDERGELAYLESSKLDNVPYYERLGFDALGQIEMDDDAPPVMRMQRRPRLTLG